MTDFREYVYTACNKISFQLSYSTVQKFSAIVEYINFMMIPDLLTSIISCQEPLQSLQDSKVEDLDAF